MSPFTFQTHAQNGDGQNKAANKTSIDSTDSKSKKVFVRVCVYLFAFVSTP